MERGRKDVPGKGFDHHGQVGQQLLCWAATDFSLRMMEDKIEEVEFQGIRCLEVAQWGCRARFSNGEKKKQKLEDDVLQGGTNPTIFSLTQNYRKKRVTI